MRMDQRVKNHILKYLSQGLRFDGRKSDEIRDISIEYDVSKTAEGSVKVKLGETEVLVGVKLEVGKPYPDKQDEGTIMVNVELLPLSSPDFESGPPSLQAIELARVIDRGMRESNAVDFKNLCIEKGEAVWNILIDVCTLNDAGNLLDAAGIGMLAALQNTYYPKLEDGKINYKEKTDKKLGLKLSPMPVTVYKLGSYFIVDPLKDEAMAADARLTVTTISDGTICALQKGGDLPLTLDDIDKMLDLAIVKANEIRKSIGDKNAKK